MGGTLVGVRLVGVRLGASIPLPAGERVPLQRRVRGFSRMVNTNPRPPVLLRSCDRGSKAGRK